MRIGRKNQPSFKIVVTEKTKSSTGGRFIEEVGFYNPVTKEKVVQAERIRYWISQGAQPTPTVSNLLISEKVVEGSKIPKHKLPRRQPAEEAGKQPETKQKSDFSQNSPEQKSDFNQNTAEPVPESPKTPEPPPQAPLSPPLA